MNIWEAIQEPGLAGFALLVEAGGVYVALRRRTV
jgi:hypothetical protein